MSGYIKIVNKKLSYKLYEEGLFGNKLRTWKNLDELNLDEYIGNVTIRYAGQYDKWCKYNVKQVEIKSELRKMADEGADLTLVRFNESAPDDHLLIQGELVEDCDYKYILSYSTDKIPMREAMKRPKEILGAKALPILFGYMSLASKENTKRLLSLYPNAVIEFSVYDCLLGNIPENNTVFWEVRNY